MGSESLVRKWYTTIHEPSGSFMWHGCMFASIAMHRSPSVERRQAFTSGTFPRPGSMRCRRCRFPLASVSHESARDCVRKWARTLASSTCNPSRSFPRVRCKASAQSCWSPGHPYRISDPWVTSCRSTPSMSTRTVTGRKASASFPASPPAFFDSGKFPRSPLAPYVRRRNSRSSSHRSSSSSSSSSSCSSFPSPAAERPFLSPTASEPGALEIPPMGLNSPASPSPGGGASSCR
mmetsp:Transcript_15356/g.43567  ORF Transcript_15356/g.43567 Transcript_15356/m.43567 type:complete len:235 (+) Transcript_15356:713-1417(+)